MSKVPDTPVFKPTTTNKTIYCFQPGTSEADKQHDIVEVEKFIAHIKAKRAKQATDTAEGVDNVSYYGL